MELVSTIEIIGEEREIADAVARGQIDGVNSNLDGLGYGENGVKNLFDKSKSTIGMAIGSSGKPYTEPEFGYSDYIEISSNTSYTYSNCSWYNFYDSNKSNILQDDKMTSISPSNAKYVVISFRLSKIDKIQLEEGTKATDYKPYIPSVKMLAEEVSEQNESLSVIGKCKNLLKPTLQTTTFNGVTCTNNGDGTYTFNGTSTNATYFQLSSQTFDSSKTYKIVGCPKGGVGKYSIYDDKNMITGVADKGDGGKPYNPSVNPKLYISIEANVELNNLVFKPMLTENLNATYDDFVPYTGDGETLTHDVAEIKNDLGGLSFSVSGTTLSITDGTNTWTLSQ